LDVVTKRGTMTLEVKSSSTSFELGSTFRVTPSPTNGTNSFTVTDGSTGDNDSSNNGVIEISSALFGDYLIEILSPPTSFVVTTNKTSLSISATANPSILFTVFSDSIAIENSAPLPATTSPILNSTSLDTLKDLSTSIVNQTSVTVDSSDDLPEMITIGSNNTSDLDTAIAKQVNILVETTTSSGITGNEFFDLIDMPTHALPSSANLTAIIAPIVTTEGSSTTRQLVCSTPFEKVIPGQNMIMTVNSTLIKSFGGVLQFNVTSSPNATSSGTFTNDYTCIESADQLISAPTLASSGIDNVVELFFDVTYRNSTTDNVGFDWHDPENLKYEGRTTVLIPKPTASNAIKLANGCADIEIHTLSDDGNTWGSSVDTIVSNVPYSEDDDYCEADILSKHFSKKAVSSKRSSSPGSSSPSSGDSGSTGSSAGSSTGSSAGSSTGRGGAGGTTSFVGIKGSPLAINEISYDKCSDNVARILVSSDADLPPTVKVSTAKSGVVYGTLAEIQPYEDLNKFSTVDRYLYEVPITSEESFMMVTVTEEIGDNTNVVRASVRLLSCEGVTVIVPLPEDLLPEVEAAAKIFDTKIQIGNATAIDAAKSEFLFVSGQDLTVSSIIDSETSLERIVLRSITMGQSDSDNVGINMDITPLYISNSTYVVTATIPSFWMVEPGMTYWLHITDEDGAQTESIHYNIGAKPTDVSDIAVEVDMPTIKPSGSIVKPEFYLFNEDKPSYGIVSLVVDGEVVSKRSQMFGTGQTQIIFNWNTPKSDGYVEYDIQGVVELYDSKVSTASSIFATHPKTVTVSGTEMPTLQVLQRDDIVLADPALVYASNADDTVRFTVTDPQGQCIIGSADECLVNESTRGKRGGLESVSYGDQILRVRYSGADNALERFSITSIDPIVGQWSVSLESEGGFVQQAHAAEDTIVKIKYRYHSETITAFSQ